MLGIRVHSIAEEGKIAFCRVAREQLPERFGDVAGGDEHLGLAPVDGEEAVVDEECRQAPSPFPGQEEM